MKTLLRLLAPKCRTQRGLALLPLVAGLVLTALVGVAQPARRAQPRYYCRESLSPADTNALVPDQIYFPPNQQRPVLTRGFPIGFGAPLCDSLGNLRFAFGAVRRNPDVLVDRNGAEITGLQDARWARNTNAATRVLVPLPHRPRFALAIYQGANPGTGRLKGVEYAYIDGQRRGGLGDVIYHPDSLNVPLTQAGWEQDTGPLTVARHANGRDLWVIATRGSYGFITFLVTPAGVSRLPVVSPVGAFTEGSIGRRPSWGYLQLAANQRTLVLIASGEAMRPWLVNGGIARAPVATFERFDFDPATGRITRPVFLGSISGATQPEHQNLGIAPDGSRLYLDEYRDRVPGQPDSGNVAAIVQYDLRAPDSVAFLASRVEIIGLTDVVPPGYHGILSGLDGRVYCMQANKRDPTNQGIQPAYMDVIERPSAPGLLCRYRHDAILVQPPSVPGGYFTNSARRYHLPLTYNDVLPTLRAVPSPCPGTASRFTLSQPGAVDSVRWHYGDGSGVVDTGFVAQHVFPGAGTWRVTATYRYNGYAVDSLTQTVRVAPAPPAQLLAAPADSVLCTDAPDALTLRTVANLPAGLRLRWDGPGTTAADTLAALTVRQPGTYGLVARLGRCESRDSVGIRGQLCPVAPEFVPNILTPNGDGLNDALVVDLPGTWTLAVFDRWGRRVWASGPGGYASGAWGGQGLAAGTYYYLLTRPADGRRVKGWVAVVR